MLRKISIIVLVLSLAVNFAAAGLWASGALRFVSSAGPARRGGAVLAPRRLRGLPDGMGKMPLRLTGAVVKVLDRRAGPHRKHGEKGCDRDGRWDPECDGPWDDHRQEDDRDRWRRHSGVPWRSGKDGVLTW